MFGLYLNLRLETKHKQIKKSFHYPNKTILLDLHSLFQTTLINDNT
jgi:acyl-CoA-binding protein